MPAIQWDGSSSHKITIHRQNLRIVLDMPAHLMDMQRAKMAAKRALPLRSDIRKVLLAEDDHAALGRQQGQLGFLRRAELAQLQTEDFGADVGRDLVDGDAGGLQEVLLRWVGAQADVCVGEFFQRRLLQSGRVVGEVLRVFVLNSVSC